MLWLLLLEVTGSPGLTCCHDGVGSTIVMIECGRIQNMRWEVLLIVVRADLGRRGRGTGRVEIVMLDYGCRWDTI